MPVADLLHPANPDQSIAAVDREVVAVAAEETPDEIYLDRHFHGFPRQRVLDIRVIAVQLPPYLAVVENEDASAARGPRQFDYGCRDLSNLGRRRGFSEILHRVRAPGLGKSEPVPAGRLPGRLRGGRTDCARHNGIEALQACGGVRDLGASRDLGRGVPRGVGVRRAGNEDRNESKYADLHGKLTVRAPASPGGCSAASMDSDRLRTNDYILASALLHDKSGTARRIPRPRSLP